MSSDYKVGDKLIYKIDQSIVEFRGYAQFDFDGAYVYPLSVCGNELYISIRQLREINQ